MADFPMIEVKGWLDNLCNDADKRGINKTEMAYLLIEKAKEYILKARGLEVYNEQKVVMP